MLFILAFASTVHHVQPVHIQFTHKQSPRDTHNWGLCFGHLPWIPRLSRSWRVCIHILEPASVCDIKLDEEKVQKSKGSFSSIRGNKALGPVCKNSPVQYSTWNVVCSSCLIIRNNLSGYCQTDGHITQAGTKLNPQKLENKLHELYAYWYNNYYSPSTQSQPIYK